MSVDSSKNVDFLRCHAMMAVIQKWPKTVSEPDTVKRLKKMLEHTCRLWLMNK